MSKSNTETICRAAQVSIQQTLSVPLWGFGGCFVRPAKPGTLQCSALASQLCSGLHLHPCVPSEMEVIPKVSGNKLPILIFSFFLPFFQHIPARQHQAFLNSSVQRTSAVADEIQLSLTLITSATHAQDTRDSLCRSCTSAAVTEASPCLLWM